MDGLRALIEANQAVIGLVVLALIFGGFLVERFPAAVVAILGICAFLLLGLLDETGLMNAMSNPAPYTIGAMFILSGALLRTGFMDAIADLIVSRAARRPRMAVAELFLGAFIASAFMNNTPVVLVLIPLMGRLAHAIGISVKALLMPLSFVAILGGTMTLIGTSTNLIVDAVAREQGVAAFGIFEVSPYGLFATLGGVVVMLATARWLLPRGDAESAARAEQESYYLTELYVHPDSNAIGRTVGEIPAFRRSRTKVLALKRGARLLRKDLIDEVLAAGDAVIVRTDSTELLSLRSSRQFTVGLGGPSAPPANSEAVVEATIAPSHPSVGRKLLDIPFLSRLRVRILGLHRPNHVPGPDLPGARLHIADRVMVTGTADAIRRMYDNPHLIGVGQTRTRPFRRDKAPIAIAALVAVVTLAALNILPILVAALLAVGVILATRCIDAEEAWGSIDGNVLILIFAMLAVGVALEEAGSVRLVVESLTPFLATVPPWALLIAVYFTSVLLTELITNNAVAVLMTPLVIALAGDLGADPRPLVIAVMFAASASFATPIGYQTNTIVYAAGNYRFFDFVKIGVPMNIIVGLTTCAGILLVY